MTFFEVLLNVEYILGWAAQVTVAVLYMGLYIGYRCRKGKREETDIIRAIILLNIILMLILSGMPLLLMGGFHLAKRALELVLIGDVLALASYLVKYLRLSRDED